MVSRCLVLTVLVACGPVKGNPPDTDATTDGPNEPGFTVTVRTANVVAPLDGKATFEIAVTRTGGFAGEVQIAPVAPPNGLEIATVTVAGDAESSEVELGALAPLAIGDTVDFDLEATATGLDSKTISVDDAEITGKPGSLDDSFGVGTGYTSIVFSGGDDDGSFSALDVLGGKVIATGIGVGGLGASRFRTMRFLADGTPDSTFGGGALVNVTFAGGSGEDTRCAAIGHQIDGRGILIGSNHSGTGVNGDVVFARLGANGAGGGVDFGNGDPGEATHDLGGDETIGRSVFTDPVGDGAVLADGKIVAVGVQNGHHLVVLGGLNGLLDTGFNASGFIRDVLGNASVARAVAIDGDGKIVVVGATTTAAGDDLTLHRYTTSGLDTSFAVGGRNILTTPNVSENPLGVVIGSQGIIFIASTVGEMLQLRRFDAAGMLDTTFGTAGVVEVPLVSGTATRKLLVLNDGKLVVVAQNGNNAIVMRFTPDGLADPRFGTDGTVTVPFGDAALVHAARVYDAHKIIIAGGNQGGVPGPGTKGLLARVWM